MVTGSFSARGIVRSVFHHGGGTRLTRFAHRHSLRILMYHRFRDIPAWDAQCRHLRRHYEPLALSEVVTRLERGEPLPPNAVVLTIDDGYRDCYTGAYPTLRKYGLPAIVYLATNLLDSGEWLWTDRVTWMYEHSPLLSSPALAARHEAAARAYERLKALPNDERMRELASLSDELRVHPPESPPADYEPLSWDEAREMARHGIEFGAHTRSHPILSRLSSRAEVAAEVVGSRERVGEELGSPVLHFCYPNGMAEDFTTETVAVVRDAGFVTAVTAQSGLNATGADRFRLRRIAQDPDNPETRFASRVAGFHV
jgi:peptidoglycan/xylan/chitin deacetylase (PgdA/CDA1 family)